MRDVLQPLDDNLTFTIHMVCAQSSSDSPKRQNTSNPMASNNTNANDSSNSSGNATQPSNDHNSRTNAETNGFQNPFNGQFMSNFTAYNPNLFNAGLSNPSLVIPPDQMWQQMALLQQTYAQYMAQYMTQYNQYNQNVVNNQMAPIVVPIPPIVVPQPLVNAAAGVANVGVANAAAVAQPPPVQRLNAGPGQQPIDEDDEQRNRDWLDYFYWMSRAVVLFSIIYFYSSFTRFLLVVFLSVVLYLYQTNWFQRRQTDNNLQPNVNNNNNDNAVNREEQVPNEADDTEVLDRVRQMATNNSTVNENRVTEDRFTGLRFFWVFVSSLFTSLIPDNPAVPVN